MRLGAVSYLNARPLVHALSPSPSFTLRFDLPSRCAELLHAGEIDVGLIPSIEYARPPSGAGEYAIVPDLAIASEGPVSSVAIFTTRPMAEVRSIALDTSSRTSVALVQVLCARVFRIAPALEHRGPDIGEMLSRADAALLIGDTALLQEAGEVAVGADQAPAHVEKIDLGHVWTEATGLPFVYACWVGRLGRLEADDIERLQQARDLGVRSADEIANAYFAGIPDRQAVARRYLRDNIKYSFGPRERAGLELFYRYAVEAGAIRRTHGLRFY